MQKQPKILIVEDDAELRNSLLERLSHGFIPVPAGDAKDMFAALNNDKNIEVILLDVLLPGVDGLSLCRELRKDNSPYSRIPVIMVSALGDPTDRVAGLHAGADDYISKPFFTAELIARIYAVLRRTANLQTPAIETADKIRFGEWTLNCKTRQLINDNGLIVMLTPGDYKLLTFFLNNPNKILSREQLAEHMGTNTSDLQNINVKIRRLRVKLGENSKSDSYIRSFRNEGYMWKIPGTIEHA